MAGLTEHEVARRAGVTPRRVRSMAEHGLLSPRPGPEPYGAADVRRVRLAVACEDAGLSMEAIGAAVRSGRLSFGFLDLPNYAVLAEHTPNTFRQVARDRSLPLDLLLGTREALGFARPLPDDPMREDDMRILRLVELAAGAGLGETVILRLLRVYGDGLSRVADAEQVVYRRYFEEPFRQAGEGAGQVMALASDMAAAFVPALEETIVAIYRRQQERAWLQNLIEGIESVLDDDGLLRRVDRPAAMCFLDLTGYTRVTEERGDEEAARLAAGLGDVVQTATVDHGGRPVKWLGDGVMSYFPDPSRSVAAALTMVARVSTAGLPAAHVGVAAGPVVYQDGDYFGRTVNLAARIADRAGPHEVLVSESVVALTDDEHIEFEEAGRASLKGFTGPSVLYRARPLASP